jgi:hypothetical protein
MSDFKVAFEPPIPPARGRHRIVPSWPNVYATVQARRLADLDPIYEVAGRRLRYHPASPEQVLSDLMGEADAFSRGVDHAIGLCGYTVLLVEFRKGRAFFTDPANSYPNGGAPIGDSFDVGEVEEALRLGADAVWEWIYPDTGLP